MLSSRTPALVLAPMDGITDAPMRALQGWVGGFSYAVSEFVRVSIEPVPARVFLRDVPELATGAMTPSGMPVQVQILGGDCGRMALSAIAAVRAGATAIDINFGCPAPTVNRNDGGASLLRHPLRIRDVVRAVRDAVPTSIPVSAKLRLGWDSHDSIFENAEMALEGGAEWLTIHARTRVQGYAPPVFWPAIGDIRERFGVPVVANGDLFTLDDFRRCQDDTGCMHYMLGRGALANPLLSRQIAEQLGIHAGPIQVPRGFTDVQHQSASDPDWGGLFRLLMDCTALYSERVAARTLPRLKQWAKLARTFGEFPAFDAVKTAKTVDEFFGSLDLRLPDSPHQEMRGEMDPTTAASCRESARR